MDDNKMVNEDGKDMDDIFAEWEEAWKNRPWYEKIWDSFYMKCLFPLKPSELRYKFLKFKSFFIRGRKGWSNMDTWDYDHYLSRIIYEGVKELRKDVHGHPANLNSMEEWYEILDKIIWTFETARKISQAEWYFLRKEDFETEEEYNRVFNTYKTISERYNTHTMTEEELVKYDEGWSLFKEYFFNLWD